MASLRRYPIFSRVLGQFEHVLIYESPDLQSKALKLIPLDDLKKKAEVRRVEEAEEHGTSFQECLLLELMAWYREFFSWCDKPSCDICGAEPSKMEALGGAAPTDDELRWQANRVELYSCGECKAVTRFPRFNHPEKLLETRRGRCGEWANCFTACCRAVGFEARLAVDWTDHVWIEIFSERQQRWLHCDLGEDRFDRPLLYEAGWGKKLTYVIAFSCEEVVDVTWRYTAHPEDVRARRHECPEGDLVLFLSQLNKTRQQSLAEHRREVLLLRSVKEAVGFLSCAVAHMDIIGQGRVSGSVEWRTARGEV